MEIFTIGRRSFLSTMDVRRKDWNERKQSHNIIWLSVPWENGQMWNIERSRRQIMKRVRERKGTNRCSFLLLSRNGGSEGTHTKKERREGTRKQTNNTIKIPVCHSLLFFAFFARSFTVFCRRFDSQIFQKQNIVDKKRGHPHSQRETRYWDDDDSIRDSNEDKSYS